MIKYLAMAAVVATSAAADHNPFHITHDAFGRQLPSTIVEPEPVLPTGPSSYQIFNRSGANVQVVACVDSATVTRATLHAGQTTVIDETDFCERRLHIELPGANSPTYYQPLKNDDIHRNITVHGSAFGQWVTSENVRYGASKTHYKDGALARGLDTWQFFN